jgi:hypothetical protein
MENGMTTAFMELAEQRSKKTIARKEQKHILDGLEKILGGHRKPDDMYAYCLEINKQLGKLVQEASAGELGAIGHARIRGDLAREGYKTYGPAFTTEEYAKKAGISRQAVLKRLKAGSLACWRENGKRAYRIPAWQFDPQGHLLPGMAEVLKILDIPEFSDWAKILFFLQRRSSLGGKRPIELVESGETETVVSLAKDYVR